MCGFFMKKMLLKFIFACILSGLFTWCCFKIPYYDIVNIPDVISLTTEDLLDLHNNKIFGSLIDMSVESTVTKLLL